MNFYLSISFLLAIPTLICFHYDFIDCCQPNKDYFGIIFYSIITMTSFLTLLIGIGLEILPRPAELSRFDWTRQLCSSFVTSKIFACAIVLIIIGYLVSLWQLQVLLTRDVSAKEMWEWQILFIVFDLILIMFAILICRDCHRAYKAKHL